MSLQTPLAKARGLGSAKQGTHHWWQQRLTAIALTPLSLWFIYSLLIIGSVDHASVTRWMSDTMNAVLLILFIVSLFHHAQLGMQVVIEDYIDSEWQKMSSIILIKFLALFAGLTSVIAILKVFLGL
ncbi:MAG: succinate dehydrogenase, hydrophobic membrane anchor protein [Gammaproteobacteria bacterium]|nr:succinate dehydrogenase, hydrophobic membrane anchor protein [Gammaproteobacteria bacterium]